MPDSPTGPAPPLAAALRRHLLRQFPADRAYDRAALRAEAMPPLVAAFIERTLDRWTTLERDRLRSGWFDFEDDAVQAAEARFFAALGRTARVPAEAWEATLGGAVVLVVRFLTTPARALTDAVFEGSPEPLPAATVRERLTLFSAYPYLADAAEVYLDRQPLDAVEPEALFYLLDRADRQATRDYGPENWLSLLQPLFELAGCVPALGGVPAPRLRDFFAAKGAAALAERLEAAGEAALDAAALREVMEFGGQRAAGGEPGPEETHDEGQKDEGQKTENGDPRVGTHTGVEQAVAAGEEPASGAQDDGAAVPLWQRFAEETAGDGSVNARFGADSAGAEGGAGAAVPPPAASEAAVPLWQQLARPPAGPTPARPTPARPTPAEAARSEAARSEALSALEERVLGRTPPERRSLYVKHLFRGDAGKYATVLHALDAAASWTEASQTIARDVFRPFRVNIYGEHAVAFTDAVEARFRA